MPGLFLDEPARGRRQVDQAAGQKRCPKAKWVMDPFHIVSWMNDALDEVRREEWQIAKAAANATKPKGKRKPGRPRRGEELPKEYKELKEQASEIKNLRYALTKNPEDLTDKQREKLDVPGRTKRKAGRHLFRAWEPREDPGAVSGAETAEEAEALLADWLHDAAYCRTEPVVEAGKKVRRRRNDVVKAVRLGISNGRVESPDQKIKTMVKVGYGFRNTDNLIAPVMLSCSDEQPVLPWEDRKDIKEKRDKRKEKDRERDREKRRRKAQGAAA